MVETYFYTLGATTFGLVLANQLLLRQVGPGKNKTRTQQETAQPSRTSLPLCPVEITFDPSNENYRRWETQPGPIPPLGDVRRKFWSFALVNPPTSYDVSNVSVVLESIEAIPSKPGRIERGTKHYGVNLKYANEGTEKTFAPGHREIITLCSSVLGTDRIRIESSGAVFQYSGNAHQIMLNITGAGHQPRWEMFKVWIDDAGALQMEYVENALYKAIQNGPK